MPLPRAVHTNITYGRLTEESVPLFEEIEAARHAGIPLPQWREMDSFDRAMYVAHYRYTRLVTLHEHAAVEADARRRTRRSRR